MTKRFQTGEAVIPSYSTGSGRNRHSVHRFLQSLDSPRLIQWILADCFPIRASQIHKYFYSHTFSSGRGAKALFLGVD